MHSSIQHYLISITDIPNKPISCGKLDGYRAIDNMAMSHTLTATETHRTPTPANNNAANTSSTAPII